MPEGNAERRFAVIAIGRIGETCWENAAAVLYRRCRREFFRQIGVGALWFSMGHRLAPASGVSTIPKIQQ